MGENDHCFASSDGSSMKGSMKTENMAEKTIIEKSLNNETKIPTCFWRNGMTMIGLQHSQTTTKQVLVPQRKIVRVCANNLSCNLTQSKLLQV